MKKLIGVLSLQGDFLEHMQAILACGADFRLVKTPMDLKGIDGLIIPGGESTTMGIIAQKEGLIKPLQSFVQSGKPVWGTCAGMILLATNVEGQMQDGQATIGGLDITVSRNFFGRQTQSFEATLSIPEVSPSPIDVFFIRAPGVTKVGPDVQVLASYSFQGKDVPVALRQGNILATAFHPELTADTSFHKYFFSFA